MGFLFFLTVNLDNVGVVFIQDTSILDQIVSQNAGHSSMVTNYMESSRTPTIHVNISYMCLPNPDTCPHGWSSHSSPTIVMHAVIATI